MLALLSTPAIIKLSIIFVGKIVALTMNYARMAATSPRARKKRLQRESEVSKELRWVKAFIARGGDHHEARAAYQRHRQQVKEVLSAAWRQQQEAKRLRALAKQRAKQSGKNGVVIITKSGPVRQRPAAMPKGRPHYRPGMSSDEFCSCWEWLTLRYEVLRVHGPKCMLCGAWGNHVDHIKPRSKHPELELVLENLQILCEQCNVGKSNLYEDDWRSRGLSPGPA